MNSVLALVRIDQHKLISIFMHSKMCAQPLQLPCLGSPFKLGMLYDCRTNKLIPGMTLWREETLTKFSSTTPQESSKFEIICEDTFQQKALQLEAGADLQLGILSGLVKVEGAAKFLYDHKTSKMMSRVTLKYKSTTTFEQLTMGHLGDVEFPEIFEKDIATHVVTGVEYGADAFFVFDQKVDKEQDIKQVEGEIGLKLHDLVSLSGMSVEVGKGSAAVTAENKIDEKKLTCRFHGDAVLQNCPTTYEEARAVCKKLPELTKSVAKKVWLLPLAHLGSCSQKFLREVSSLLFQKIQKLLEFMAQVEIQINNMIQSEAFSCFKGINKELKSLKRLVDGYALSVRTDTARLLPQIREGKVEEAKLEKLITKNSLSPFSEECLSSLIDEKENEVKQLEQFLTYFKQKMSLNFVFENGALDAIVDNIDGSDVVCFDFNLHWGTNDALKEMEAYLQGQKATQKKKPEHVPKPWYTGCELETIKKQMRLFVGHVEANPGKQKYVVTNGQSKLAKQASGEVGIISLYHDPLSPTEFDPLGPPGKPRVEKVTSNSVQLVWEASEQGSTNIKGYTVSYSYETDKWLDYNTDSRTNRGLVIVDNLIPNTAYCFRVQAINDTGTSPFSPQSDTTTTEPPIGLKVEYIPHSQLIEEGSPKVYALPTHVTSQNNLIEKRDALASPLPAAAANPIPQKVIMLVGATGSGKSTLINAMANYILGVNWEDDVRFKLITEKTSDDQSKSQTKLITAYTFHMEKGFPFPYSLTVIDTPGYGDTEGLARDKKITAQIKEFFSSENGIDQIHAVGFVVQSSLARLTPTQSYIFNAILSIFGKDIAENIFLMTTFADSEDPEVLAAVEKAEVPFVSYFEFNNSAVFAKKSKSKRTRAIADFFEMGTESFQKFFDTLLTVEARSLQLTKEVLDERQHLEVVLEGLVPQIQTVLDEKSKLKHLIQQLEQQEANMRANKNYTVVVKVPKQRKISIVQDKLYNTKCKNCNIVCHPKCTISDDTKKYKCAAMTWFTRRKNTKCKVCPGECSWTDHKNVPYRLESYEEEETQTLQAILKRYKVAESSKNQLEDLIAKINTSISEIEDGVQQMLEKARRSLVRLQEIALRPNPMSQEEYIELLIKSEKREHKHGWEDRVKSLEEAKIKALLIAEVSQEKQHEQDTPAN